MAPHYLNVWTAVANKTAGAPVGGAGFEATGTEDRRHVQSCWGDTLCVCVCSGGGRYPHLVWNSSWAALVLCTGKTHFPDLRPGPVQTDMPAWPCSHDTAG